MVEDRRSPFRRHMAGLAIITGGEMIEGLAFRTLPVVAGDAGAARLRVIEFFDLPIRRAVAAGAFRAGRNVVLWLAGGHVALVAGETPRRERRMIDIDLCPTDRSMTLAAGLGGFRVIFRLALGHSAVVAFLASRRHALEHGTRVTGFARHRTMRALEWKTRLPVIEVAVDLDAAVDLLRRCGSNDQRQHNR